MAKNQVRATLTGQEIDLLRQLVEQSIDKGRQPYEAYREAADKLEGSKNLARRKA